jgi:hypothetical protein
VKNGDIERKSRNMHRKTGAVLKYSKDSRRVQRRISLKRPQRICIAVARFSVLH